MLYWLGLFFAMANINFMHFCFRPTILLAVLCLHFLLGYLTEELLIVLHFIFRRFNLASFSIVKLPDAVSFFHFHFV